MTMPTVPIVRNIADLRRLWPEWVITKGTLTWGRGKGSVYYGARPRTGGSIRSSMYGDEKPTAAEATQALADKLIAAGYEPKGE